MLYPNVNWLKEIFKPCGTNTRANINMYDGGEFSQYYVSLGYYNEGGLYRIKNDEQYNGRMEFNRMNYVSNITMQPTIGMGTSPVLSCKNLATRLLKL